VFAAQVHRGQVDVLHAPPRVQLGGEDRVVVRWRDSRVVEGDVDSAVLVHRGLEQLADLGLGGDVDRYVQAADLGGRLAAGLVVGIPADDLGALGGEPAYGSQPDPAARAGDDGNLAGETIPHGARSFVRTFSRSRRRRSWSRWWREERPGRVRGPGPTT